MPTTPPRTVCFKTMGCQMNMADSERMFSMLHPMGWEKTDAIEQADAIIINTCSVREGPQHKVPSLLGTLRTLKRENPNLLIIVTGCVAQQLGKTIIHDYPHVNWVLGPDEIDQLPHLIQTHAPQSSYTHQPFALSHSERVYHQSLISSESSISNYVVIMKGCDQFCSYCIVPYTRGRELSRPMDEVLHEINHHLAQGTREIILLGQNIDTYGMHNDWDLASLLYKAHELEGLWRLRFLTSHPRYFDDRLIQCFQKLDNLCDYLHLPVQSGSNRILERMNRKHSKKEYMDKIQALRKVRPNIALSSDFIVGFPGETQADFEETLDLIHTIHYDQCFSFMYSERPGTKAAQFEDDIPIAVKKERIHILQELIYKQVLQRNQQLLGQKVPVLVEGFSNKNKKRWTGRTSSNKIVNFTGPDHLQGLIVSVEIEQAVATNLQGTFYEYLKSH